MQHRKATHLLGRLFCTYFCHMFTIPSHAFQVPIHIGESDIDALNHVNNTVYLRWVQDVATAHWETLTTATQRQQYWWVVRRHEIDYLRPCMLGDTIIAYTWVRSAQGKASDRIVVFQHNETGKTIAQVKTTWILVDPATQRGTTIPEELLRSLGL